MDAVPCGWNAAQAQESFARGKHTADTLTKLAKLMARADHKPDARTPRPPPPLLPAAAPPPPPYACAECGRGFADTAELRHHRRGEHPLPKPHQCAACGKAFSLLSSLQLHRRLHGNDDDDAPPCELCGGGGKAPPPPGAPPCPGCAAAATAATSDPESPGDESPPPPPPSHHPGLRRAYACAPCGRAFSQKQALLHHQQSGCSDPREPDDRARSPPAPLDSPSPGSPASEASNDPDDADGPAASCPCPYCARSFRSPAGLTSHQRTHHPQEWFLLRGARPGKAGRRGGGGGGGRGRPPGRTANGTPKQKLLACRSCDMEFPSTAKLYLHRKDKHSREKDIRRGGEGGARPLVNKRRKGETYPCQVCGKVFLHHLSLRAHAKLHNAQSQAAVSSGPAGGKTPRGGAAAAKLTEKKPKKTKANPPPSGGDAPAARPGPGRPRKEARPPLPSPPLPPPTTQERPEEEGEFPCPSCAEVFPLQSALREHAELHQPSARRRQCSVCSQDMDAAPKGPGAKRQRLYHCGPCQRAFTGLDAFLQHCQVHLLARVEEEEGEEEGGGRAERAGRG